MRVNELRVGNYVKTKHQTKYIINSITKGGGWIELTDGFEECDSDIDSIEPLPLTEEILLKCGEKYNNSGFNLGKFKVLKSTEGVFIIPTNNKLVQIYFVHDLQNFYYYYENTKTELIINL